MPFYEYRCSSCGKLFDKMLPVDRRNEALPCPDCGGKAARKAISSFGTSGQMDADAGGGCGGG